MTDIARTSKPLLWRLRNWVACPNPLETAHEAAGEIERQHAEFKNFHRLLCERFGYVHDEKDWKRDQLSLIEWIATHRMVEPGVTAEDDPWAKCDHMTAVPRGLQDREGCDD